MSGIMGGGLMSCCMLGGKWGAGHCPAQLLHHAVSSGHAHLVTTAHCLHCYINTVTLQVSLLLTHPATDPNQPDPGGVTPVHLAALQGRDKIIRLMGGTEIVINVFNSPYLHLHT